MEIKNLTKNDTNVLKGFAILLMLIHHLFFVQNGLFNDIHLYGDHYLVNEIGIFSKICVAIFVFLSGYGLAICEENRGNVDNLKAFYLRRFKKLFLNYWFIWVLFVPISVFIFNYSFTEAYQNHIYSHLIADIIGLHAIIYRDVYCYNPTWWFYSCIIILYLLFPFLYRWAKKDAISVVLVSIAVSFLPIPRLVVIKFYIFAFVIGILFVVRKLPPPNYPNMDVDYIICTIGDGKK